MRNNAEDLASSYTFTCTIYSFSMPIKPYGIPPSETVFERKAIKRALPALKHDQSILAVFSQFFNDHLLTVRFC